MTGLLRHRDATGVKPGHSEPSCPMSGPSLIMMDELCGRLTPTLPMVVHCHSRWERVLSLVWHIWGLLRRIAKPKGKRPTASSEQLQPPYFAALTQPVGVPFPRQSGGAEMRCLRIQYTTSLWFQSWATGFVRLIIKIRHFLLCYMFSIG